MPASTSGTVSAYGFNMSKVIDHAFRRAGKLPEKASAEQLQIATDLVYSITSEWINAGFPLWTRQFLLLPCGVGQTDVVCPPGTVDVFHAYWRIINPWRGAATLSTGANGSVLFGGVPNSDVPITSALPAVWVNFGSPIEVDTVGVLPGGPFNNTAALQLSVSPDGVNWTVVQTLPGTTFAPQTWAYFDLSPSITSQYLQIANPNAVSYVIGPNGQPVIGPNGLPVIAPGPAGAATWTLNQLNFGLANGQDIEIGPLNIDDYWNLPDKFFQSGRPNSSYTDRQLNAPVIKIWPTLNLEGYYNGTVTALVRRYIQDPGSLTNNVEIPQRWAEAMMWRLATMLIYELPDEDQSSTASYFSLMAKQQRITAIEAKAAKSEALAWAEERTRAPLRLMPNLRAYTA
jgi:hypothetical protein